MQKKKVLFHQDSAPCHKSMKTMVKLNELNFELLPHPPYSPDLALSGYWLFADLKKMLQGKRFGSNKEVIAETEAYFESKNESLYKKSARFAGTFSSRSSRASLSAPRARDLIVVLRARSCALRIHLSLFLII